MILHPSVQNSDLPVVVILFTPKSVFLQLVCQVGQDDITKMRQPAVPFTLVSHRNIQNIRCIRLHHSLQVVFRCVFSVIVTFR